MATYKIMMIGGRRCGKTTILSKIRTHFNEVLHHDANEQPSNDLLTLLPPTDGITRLNNAQQCINDLFSSVEDCYQEFAIDENANQDKSKTTFSLSPLKGAGSIKLEFTDIPGEWCSNVNNSEDERKHIEEVKQMITDSNVIIMAIDTPSLIEEKDSTGVGRYADYYNRIKDITDLFKNALSGEILSDIKKQKMIIFVPLKCEKYVINEDGSANLNEQRRISDLIENAYETLITYCTTNGRQSITMAITPIVTIKEVEWSRFYSLNINNGEEGGIYRENGTPITFRYGDSVRLCSKFRFKHDLYDEVADGYRESQSLYCEQPLIYALSFLLKYYTTYGRTRLAWLFDLFNAFSSNPAYSNEAVRLRSKKMLRERHGFKILQNPLGI